MYLISSTIIFLQVASMVYMPFYVIKILYLRSKTLKFSFLMRKWIGH